MSGLARLGALLLLALAPLLHAHEAARVTSPDGQISVSIDIDGDGHARYAVTRGTALLIAPSQLGFLLTDAPKLHRNLKVTGTQARSVDESWTQ
ncbi:MAG: glycoside hydrolase family 97 N-terminal domain-containing protein, partial [Polymorphobacter sp.]